MILLCVTINSHFLQYQLVWFFQRFWISGSMRLQYWSWIYFVSVSSQISLLKKQGWNHLENHQLSGGFYAGQNPWSNHDWTKMPCLRHVFPQKTVHTPSRQSGTIFSWFNLKACQIFKISHRIHGNLHVFYSQAWQSAAEIYFKDRERHKCIIFCRRRE